MRNLRANAQEEKEQEGLKVSDGIKLLRSSDKGFFLVQLHEKAADASRRACVDCRYLRGYTTWWCSNDDAKKLHGTSMPGRAGCPFWDAPLVYGSVPPAPPSAPKRRWWSWLGL